MTAAKKDDNGSEDNAPKLKRFQTPKGVNDILPKDHEYYTFIKNKLNKKK